MGVGIRSYLITFFVTLGSAAMLLAAFVAAVGERVGATISPSRLASIQSADPDKIVLPFDLRYWADYKLAVAAKQRPEIIYISSSRAGAVRSQMFHPYSFYNLSFSAWTIDQVTEIFERATRDFRPRVVILELDYFMFTEAWIEANADRSMIFDGSFRYIVSGVKDFLRSFVRQPTKFLHPDNRFVGTQAILNEEGFRADGSHLFSQGHIEHSRQHDLTANFLVQAMPGGPSISQKQRTALQRLSDLARDRGISLVGIQLPYIKEAVEYLDTNEGYHHYSGVWREFESAETHDRFAKMGIEFFDLARTEIGNDKSNFIDAYHPAEKGMLKAMQELLKRPDFRAVFPDVSVF
jgi:hypothetical protein